VNAGGGLALGQITEQQIDTIRDQRPRFVSSSKKALPPWVSGVYHPECINRPTMGNAFCFHSKCLLQGGCAQFCP
jgi:hypothetical protein